MHKATAPPPPKPFVDCKCFGAVNGSDYGLLFSIVGFKQFHP